jgi:energy-coupling factor transporter ATP-binding protein EcfA2
MYTYSLHHYHAIGDAELQINGITVLAGINGSGKSTLSRWLYYVVNAASHFDEFMFHQYQSRMMRRLRSLRNILREVVETSREQTYMMDALRAINRLNYREEEVADEMTSIYDKVLIRFSEDLQEFFTTSMSTLRKQRVRRYLDLTMEDDVQLDTILESFMEKERRMARSLKKSYLEKITQRSLRSLQEIIMERYDETDKMPDDLQFSEEGVDLLSDTSIGTIFNLERAIYVDTPMAVMETSSENVLWNSLLKIMREPSIDRIASENEKASRLLLHRITRFPS